MRTYITQFWNTTNLTIKKLEAVSATLTIIYIAIYIKLLSQ